MAVTEPTIWCAQIIVAPKKVGIRLCVDLTKFNESVLRERHMLLTPEQTLASLASATVFSKLDSNSAFLQIPLSEESQLLTTFLTSFGRFCLRRLPFGFNASSEHYQRRILATLEGIESVVCLIDDILVSGRNQKEHDARLH